MLVATRFIAKLVALFVHQQLTLDALESLPAQTPDTVVAKGAEGFLWMRERESEKTHVTGKRTCKIVQYTH